MRRVFLCDKVFGGGADVDKALIQEGSFGGKTQTLKEVVHSHAQPYLDIGDSIFICDLYLSRREPVKRAKL